jgi:hypothetical protein
MYLILRHSTVEHRIDGGDYNSYQTIETDHTVPVGVATTLQEAETALVVAVNREQHGGHNGYSSSRGNASFSIQKTDLGSEKEVFEISIERYIRANDEDVFNTLIGSTEYVESGFRPNVGEYLYPKLVAREDTAAYRVSIGKRRKGGDRQVKIHVHGTTLQEAQGKTVHAAHIISTQLSSHQAQDAEWTYMDKG